MEVRRRVFNVGISFFLAAATGHLMQNGDAIMAMLRGEPAPPSYVLTQVEPTVAVIAPAAAATLDAVPRLPGARGLPGEATLAERIRLLDTNAPDVALPAETQVPGFRCGAADAAGPATMPATHASVCHGA